jgi:hypothetical protein
MRSRMNKRDAINGFFDAADRWILERMIAGVDVPWTSRAYEQFGS